MKTNEKKVVDKKKSDKVKSDKVKQGVSAGFVILCCFIIAELFFNFVCGDPSNFVDGNPKGHPIQGNIFATLYKGGMIVPLIMTLLLTVITLAVERFFAMNRANGKGNLVQFVHDVKRKLDVNDIKGAHELCNKQKGATANILNAALVRYEDVEKIENMTNDQKAEIIQKEIEEATALELPAMEQNLPIIATISTLGTLVGLLGTVLGMIRSFAALANEGAPDSLALSTGISEALMNTALGIGTGALAIIFYNVFAQKVQGITNAVNEIGFAIGQTYSKKHQG